MNNEERKISGTVDDSYSERFVTAYRRSRKRLHLFLGFDLSFLFEYIWCDVYMELRVSGEEGIAKL